MRFTTALLLFSVTLSAQTQTPAQQDAAAALQAFQLLGAPMATLANMLAKLQGETTPPNPDPVTVMLKASMQVSGASLYDALSSCASTLSTCQVIEVLYVCPRPAAWAPGINYAVGALATNSVTQDVYRLTSGGGTSGTATPKWLTTSPVTDGPNTWTFAFSGSTQYFCSVVGAPLP